MISELMEKKKYSKYRLAKESNIPYSTITDICSGKAQLEKCSAETIYKLAKTLGTSMEALIAPCFWERCSFENFKSNVCHQVKRLGDFDFLIETLETDDIRTYYNRQWYPESFYLLAMLDYVSRINNIPLCEEYNDLRSQRLSEPLYPASIIAMSLASNDNRIKEESIQNSIPEFRKFNIIESEIRNVI